MGLYGEELILFKLHFIAIKRRAEQIVMDHLEWVAATLLFPYLVPIILFKLLQWMIHNPSPEQAERLRITYLLKEGQFALTSSAIAAASFYELKSTPGGMDHSLGTVLSWALIILGGVSVLVFVAGTIFGAPEPREVKDLSYRGWFKVYRAGAASIVLAAGVSVCAFATHWHASQRSSASPEWPLKIVK